MISSKHPPRRSFSGIDTQKTNRLTLHPYLNTAETGWLNVKPSRFGTVESLFETVEYAEERGVSCYGGGQFELDVGRAHVQTLAAIFYPDGPNDVAPAGYNLPDLPPDLPDSPLVPDPDPQGLDF